MPKAPLPLETSPYWTTSLQVTVVVCLLVGLTRSCVCQLFCAFSAHDVPYGSKFLRCKIFAGCVVSSSSRKHFSRIGEILLATPSKREKSWCLIFAVQASAKTAKVMRLENQRYAVCFSFSSSSSLLPKSFSTLPPLLQIPQELQLTSSGQED